MQLYKDMSRTERLLDLLQLLRCHKYPVSGQALAEKLGVSQRTIYRDIQTLQHQGANIEGEAGVGYVLRDGYLMPPLMLTEQEVEALVLGSRWVRKYADAELGEAAHNVVSKIESVIPVQLKKTLNSTTLLVGKTPKQEHNPTISLVRKSVREEMKLKLSYCDLEGKKTQRVVWPFAIGFFEQVQILGAWCELRQAFRHFRMDRIEQAVDLGVPYAQGKMQLFSEWCKSQNIGIVY